MMSIRAWRGGAQARLRFGVAVLLCLAASVAALAGDGVPELEKKLEQSDRKVEKLQQRVRDLEQWVQGQRAVPDSPRPAAPAPASAEAPVTDTGFLDEVTWLHGFADVGFAYSGVRPPYGERHRGFNVGSLDFYLTPSLGPRVKSLAELIFEIRSDGETHQELERLQIGYAFGDYLTLWAGRYHTPLGYWNTAFHHGRQLQTSIARPKFLEFEEDGGLLPTHMVGLWATGGARTGLGRVSYDLYLANAPKIEEDGIISPNAFGGDQFYPAYGFNAGWEPDRVEGLRLGLHALGSRIDSWGAGNARIGSAQLCLFGAYGLYSAHDWEIVSEFYQLLNLNRFEDRDRHGSTLGFLQVGHLLGSFTPYGRIEFASLSQGDNYFSRLKHPSSYLRFLAGLRYDLSPTAALKLEGNRTTLLNRDEYFETSSQFEIRF